MSWPLLISTTIALIAVDSTGATPFIWDVDKRAESQKFENADTTTTKKSESTTKKPTSTTAKDAASTSASKKPASASSSAQPSSSAAVASSTAITSSTSTQPPLMVVNPTPNASSSSAIPSSTSTTQKDASSASVQNGGGISGGAIGGIVAAIIIIIAGVIAYLILRRKRNRKNAQRNMNSRMSKPDPFTMGFGSDQAFHNTQSSYQQPQMQQNNLQVNTSPYQHQYGTVQPAIAVTSPTSPSSPYYNNNGTQFHDANNHIITASMMPAIVPQQQQPSQYQPNTIYQQEQSETHATINDTGNAVPANASAAAAVTAAAAAATTAAVGASAGSVPHQQQALLPPTQAGSVGVFYVAATYTPTLSDEIDIQTGDQVEILVEYDDGWCQGINLSRGNTKGVFPKHCVEYPTSESTASSDIDRVKRVSSMYIAQ
ncbi:uncharacterized protein ATC70_003018 [Mucor velutinosus]|uniref:SH3 domain-containing protein n=1 Tax=Mucor velutinosus TaxID=708070 RepID=A0AAN7DAW8_9FUNG|nr:hypothetical protein ATC70_003018 [Mucor velutinosus]